MDTLAETRDGVRSLIARQALAAELETSKAAPSPAGSDSQENASAAYAITDLNKVLLRGALDNVVVLYNAGPKAPSLLRTISGQFSLTKNEAWNCLLGPEKTPALEKALLGAIEPLGGKARRADVSRFFRSVVFGRRSDVQQVARAR